MTFGGRSGLEGRSKDWVLEMLEFLQGIDEELEATGELVEQRSLADPSEGKTVHMDAGLPFTANEPFADPARSLSGYWVVEVADEARAIEIATEVTVFLQDSVEVRQVLEERTAD